MFFTAHSLRSFEAKSSRRCIYFPSPLTPLDAGQGRRRWENAHQLTLRKRQKPSILWLRGVNRGILLPEGLSRFAFRRLSEKQKKNQKLCALCDSAVNNFFIKTLLGVVIDRIFGLLLLLRQDCLPSGINATASNLFQFHAHFFR